MIRAHENLIVTERWHQTPSAGAALNDLHMTQGQQHKTTASSHASHVCVPTTTHYHAFPTAYERQQHADAPQAVNVTV